MKRRKVVGALLCGFALLPLAALPDLGQARPPTRAPGIQDSVLTWELKQAKVLSRGSTTTIEQGTMTQGYVVEALAQSPQGVTPVRKAHFQVRLDAFSPKRDMPGQTAGQWYVHGDWRIVAAGASAEEAQARHSPSLINGSLLAELPFNPATGAGPVNARLRLQRGPQGGRWASGAGTFTGNDRFEGVLQIDARVWPTTGR